MRIYDRLDKLLDILKDKRFRDQKGLGNEIGFHIFDYDPQDELIVRDRIRFIKDALKHEDFEIQEFDLYELILDELEKEDLLDAVLEVEEEEGAEALYEALKNVIEDGEVIVNRISREYHDNAIVFITGVGKAWPIIRSHSILNKLHPAVEKAPLVLFYPGIYSGQELILFNMFKDNNYYRAFNLVGR